MSFKIYVKYFSIHRHEKFSEFQLQNSQNNYMEKHIKVKG